VTQQNQEVLSGLPRIVRDESIPRFTDITVSSLGGGCRIRRYEPEQTKKIRQDLQAVGCQSHEYDIGQHGVDLAVKILQICLVPTDSNRLLFPGYEGKLALENIPGDDLQSVARMVIATNKVFGEVPTTDTHDIYDVED